MKIAPKNDKYLKLLENFLDMPVTALIYAQSKPIT